MHVLYACIYPKLIQIAVQQEIECQLLVGCRVGCLSEETCLPFPACANKALVVGACHCLFSLTRLQTVCFEEPKKNGNRRKRSVHTAGWWCVNRMSATQDLYHRISDQDLCSLHQVSVQNLHKRSSGKISVQDLWEVSWQDICKSSL